MALKVTLKEAEQIVQDSKVAEAAAWVAYRAAKIELPPFDAGLKPCPKCGRDMKVGQYVKAYEPHEQSSLSDGYLYSFLLNSVVPTEPTPKTDKPKTPKWSWTVENVGWSCKCGYGFKTKPKDAE